METQTFFANRSKYLFILFLGVLMIGSGFFVLYEGIRTANGVFLAIGVFGVLFFGLCFVAAMRSYRKAGPTLTIDADGIVLANYTMAVGRIPWSSIKGTKIQYVTVNLFQRFKYITIDVVDNEAIFASVPKWKRMLLKSNMPYFATPVFIGYADLKEPLEEVQLALENALYAKRTQHRQGEHATNERVAERAILGR